MKQYNTKFYINKFCPNLLKLYTPTNREWKNINIKLDKRYTYNKNNNSDTKIEATLFDYILKSLNKNDDFNMQNYYSSFLSYLNNICEKLYQILPTKIIKSQPFKLMILNSMQNFDNTKSRCLDHLSEIIVLEKILATNYFSITGLEEPTQNGPSIDFSLVDINNIKYLVELFTIKYYSSFLETAESLHVFLAKRFTDKIKKKKLSQYQSNQKNIIFIINLHDRDDYFNIVKFYNYFNKVKILNSWNVIFAMLKSYNKNNVYYFDYSLVSKLIENYKA